MQGRILEALEHIQNEKKSFSFEQNEKRSDAVSTYINYYQLPAEGVDYQYGYVHSGNKEIYLQSFSPNNPRGTVFLMHGYLDHLGCLSHFITYLTGQGYQVIGFDLPGHGLSTGEKASIDDFQEYVAVLDNVINLVMNDVYTPLYLVAHSTGAAISFSYLVKQHHCFERVVMIAPLIRAASFRISQIMFVLAKPFIKQFPRVFWANSNEQAFLEFIKKDPLQAKKLSMNWIGAKLKWFNTIKGGQACECDVLILQGDQDKTVDWKYNLSYLEKSVPNNEIHVVEGGGHHLLNEVQLLQEKIFNQIERFFSSEK
ncbi:alpha/beta hydrolase [Alkalihalobacillus sp. 1P02AB]|uniref:alpha/beta hydrolase n=1 Tax=Alkalihalobacillus sp. 1P02AB TaxID=3132260 RepID=UPI0039A5E12D